MVGLVLVGSIAGPAAAEESAMTHRTAFVVELSSDGDARVGLVETFDLATGDERRAFESIRDDETLRGELRSRFYDRVRAIAANAENATGRPMEVSDPAVDIAVVEDGTQGVIDLSVEWHGLAVADGDRLVVAEPFAGDFAPDRPFVLRAPGGYTVAEATPDPSVRNGTGVAWEADRTLDGFRVVFERREATGPATTAAGTPAPGRTATGGQPGLGTVAALLALSALFVASRLRS